MATKGILIRSSVVVVTLSVCFCGVGLCIGAIREIKQLDLRLYGFRAFDESIADASFVEMINSTSALLGISQVSRRDIRRPSWPTTVYRLDVARGQVKKVGTPTIDAMSRLIRLGDVGFALV